MLDGENYVIFHISKTVQNSLMANFMSMVSIFRHSDMTWCGNLVIPEWVVDPFTIDSSSAFIELQLQESLIYFQTDEDMNVHSE